jgi:hypothetical protein
MKPERKMDDLNVDVLARQYADSVVEIGFARSVQSLGYESHAFVLGHLQADLMFILEDLNLTQKQLKILSERVL